MFRVTNTTRGTAVGESVELANTSLKRMVGLLGRRGLDAGGGLWIKPSSGVHGLDRDLKVIKLWRCLAPFRLTAVSMKLRSVLELPCGTITRSQIHIGDQIQIDPASEPIAAPAEGS